MAKGKTIAVFFGGCASLSLIMIAVCAGLIYFGYQSAETNVSPRVDALFAAIENNSLADTYETDTSQELRDAVSKDEYMALGDAVRTRLGKLKSKSMRSVNMAQQNADSYINVSYHAKFEKGHATIIAILKQEGESWKFVRLQVDSPLLTPDAATAECPSCGKPVAADARFCPSCGAEISADAKDASSPRETTPDKSATEPDDDPKPQ